MKIICFGDSNTYGYDPRSYFGEPYSAGWVEQLADQLNCTIINAGENGREIPRGEGELKAFDRLMRNQEPIDLLIIMLGTNDLLQGNSSKTVTQRMESFLKHITLDKSRILLIAPPSMQLGEWVPTKTLVDASAALHNEYRALSERFGVGFVNAGAWNIPLTFDGVHFTEEGHRVFAEGLGNYLTKENYDA